MPGLKDNILFFNKIEMIFFYSFAYKEVIS